VQVGRPVSEGGGVGVDSGGESLEGEGGRRQGQSTEYRGNGPPGVHALLYTLVGEKVSCHQQAEQLRVSSGCEGPHKERAPQSQQHETRTRDDVRRSTLTATGWECERTYRLMRAIYDG
jgi:hypothetical protein